MTTLGEIVDAVLAHDGGFLGGDSGTVDVDPDILDPDAARALISGKLYDGEKLSGSFGGMYFSVPRYGDSRRADERGYRVRYISVFEPPETGSFTFQFYGFGETIEIPVGAPAESVEQSIHEVGDGGLGDASAVLDDQGRYEIHLPQRVGMGATAGRLTAAGGVGVVLMSADWSQPLTKGTRWKSSPVIPFCTMDGITGIRECINNALADLFFDDLYPIEVIGNPQTRDRSLQIYGITPWLEPDYITGYFAPTDWESHILFYPPKSGTYTATLKTSLQYGPFASPLPYNATGAQLEAALRSIGGIPSSASNGRVTVTPQGAASAYTIIWRTQHHRATIVPSRGVVASVTSHRLREPFPVSLVPYYMPDANEATLTDPGYEEGVSWFVASRRRGHTRVLPQSYPLKSDGTLNLNAEPIPGTEWVDSTVGLVNDLDQTFIPVERIAPGAFRYCLAAIAANAQGGDQTRWEQKGGQASTVAAAGIVYGPRTRRGNKVTGGWPVPLGNKAAPYFLPGR